MVLGGRNIWEDMQGFKMKDTQRVKSEARRMISEESGHEFKKLRPFIYSYDRYFPH